VLVPSVSSHPCGAYV